MENISYAGAHGDSVWISGAVGKYHFRGHI